MVKEAQMKFIEKLTSRDNFIGSPANFVLNLVTQAGTQAGKYIDNLLQFEPGDLRTSSAEALKSRITESLSSRRKAYCEFNPHLERHEIYSANVPEYMRVAFSRIRLGSHRLKIETGRWSRIPREARLCTCGAIQTEQHVLLLCPDSEPLRGQFPRLDFKELGALMNGNCLDLANFCYMVLQKFGNIKGES